MKSFFYGSTRIFFDHFEEAARSRSLREFFKAFFLLENKTRRLNLKRSLSAFLCLHIYEFPLVVKSCFGIGFIWNQTDGDQVGRDGEGRGEDSVKGKVVLLWKSIFNIEKKRKKIITSWMLNANKFLFVWFIKFNENLILIICLETWVNSKKIGHHFISEH